MRRAMRDDQKQQRRQDILDAAWALFQEQAYDSIAVIDIARAAGLAKGTVYLYFKTKESLFLAVLVQQFGAWFDTVDARLEQAGGIDATAAVLLDALAERPALLRLFAITHPLLEQNVTAEDVRVLKGFMLERMLHTGALLERALPFLPEHGGAAVLLQAYALVLGLQQIAAPSPVVRDVLAADPALARVFDIDFAAAFQSAFRTYLIGLHTLSQQLR